MAAGHEERSRTHTTSPQREPDNLEPDAEPEQPDPSHRRAREDEQTEQQRHQDQGDDGGDVEEVADQEGRPMDALEDAGDLGRRVLGRGVLLVLLVHRVGRNVEFVRHLDPAFPSPGRRLRQGLLVLVGLGDGLLDPGHLEVVVQPRGLLSIHGRRLQGRLPARHVVDRFQTRLGATAVDRLVAPERSVIVRQPQRSILGLRQRRWIFFDRCRHLAPSTVEPSFLLEYRCTDLKE